MGWFRQYNYTRFYLFIFNKISENNTLQLRHLVKETKITGNFYSGRLDDLKTTSEPYSNSSKQFHKKGFHLLLSSIYIDMSNYNVRMVSA